VHHGNAAKYEAINRVMTGTLERGLLAKVESKADFHDAIASELGGRTQTNVGRAGNSFQTVLMSWSGDPE
jgi:hypothetical protein